jgi:hypothetical protein
VAAARYRDCQRALQHARVQLRHPSDDWWDNWGHIISVLEPDERVEAENPHDGQVVYCASAVSARYPGISDTINLNNFEGL